MLSTKMIKIIKINRGVHMKQFKSQQLIILIKITFSLIIIINEGIKQKFIEFQ